MAKTEKGHGNGVIVLATTAIHPNVSKIESENYCKGSELFLELIARTFFDET